LRVLITRPGEDGTALAEVLRARGIETVIEPLLAIKYIDGPALDVNSLQALLLTSANGVRALARRTDRRDIPVYAVGDSTATTARKAGFVQVHSAAGNVETLVGLVKQILDPQEGPLLHIAGSDVAGDLISLIESAGFECTRETLYEAIVERSLKSSTIASLKDGQIDAVSLYSPRSAENFVELIRKARLVRSCQRIIAICLSQAVADKVSEIQWRDVLTAIEPNQDALLKLVIGLDGKNNYQNVDEVNTPKITDQTVIENFAQVNVDPANEVVQNSLSTHRPAGGKILTVFLTLLVMAILVGVGFASKPLWPTEVYSLASLLFEEPERNIKLTVLNGRLKALEDVQQVPNFNELQKERKRLQAKLDVTLKRVSALENSINSTKKMVKAVGVEAGVEAGRTLKKILGRIQKLENRNLGYQALVTKTGGKTIERLTEKVIALEQKVPSFIGGNRNTEIRTLILSVGLLRDSVRAGRSFDSELAALKILVDINQHTKALLSDGLTIFDKFAKFGVPTLHMLQSQFAEKAGSIVQVSLLPSDGGWAKRTLARLAESVKWRRTDNLIGGGVEAVVARTELALKSNNIATAIKELSILKGKPAELTADWLNGARAYIIVEKALAELQTQVVTQMTTGQ
jgi:uroporphyrinogen-III synthase